MATAKKAAKKAAKAPKKRLPPNKGVPMSPRKGFVQTASLLDKVKVVQGRLVRVQNVGRKFGANDIYIAVQVEDANGKNERCLLFSEDQILVAQDRAKKNREDLTKKDWFTDLTD